MDCKAHVRPTDTGIQEIFACEIQNLGKFVLESGIRLPEPGIPLTTGIQNPSSTDKDWNPVPGSPESSEWNPESKAVIT